MLVENMNIIYEKVDVARIIIKKPTQLQVKKVFPLAYRLDETSNRQDSDVIIQTPVMILPYGPIQIEGKRGIELQFDCCNDAYISHLESIRDSVTHRIQTVCGDSLFASKKQADCILQRDFGKVFRCKCRLQATHPVLYDTHGNTAQAESLHEESNVQLLVGIRWVWVSNTHFGIEFNILQVKIMTPFLSHLMISDAPATKNGKYYKMIKLGIPIGAVLSKMRLDGISEEDVNEFQRDEAYSPSKASSQLTASHASHAPRAPRAPPLPPPLPSKACFLAAPLSTPPPLSGVQPFLAQIKNGDFQLRKTRSLKERIFKYIDTNRLMPTLDDIVKAKSKLRSFCK